MAKSHRLFLAYKYKKMIYNKKIKKILPKKPNGPYQIFLKEKKGLKINANEGSWLNYWKKQFDSLSEDQKKNILKSRKKKKRNMKRK